MKKQILKLASCLALLGTAAPVLAQSTIINFEDGLVEHENLGFITTAIGGASSLDNWLLAGLANGDPGNWGMEGSNGAHLLGISGDFASRGQAYTGSGDTEYAAIDFTVPNTTTPKAVNVSFDVLERSVASGGANGTFATFYGFNNGSLVATITPTLSVVTIDGYFEQMATVSFSGIDEIRFNTTTYGGVDNIIISHVPEPSTLALAGLGGLGMLWQLRRRK
jgi:hypothetical protein